jgi:hypothetical protein
MDRRRRLGFHPTPEVLEGRQLLATSSLFSGQAAATAQSSDVPLATLPEKLQRIERLPYFLDSLDPNRPVPEPLMKQIQADLLELVGRLNPVPSAGLSDFNRQLRGLLAEGSVHADTAGQLNASFLKILQVAGAPPESAEGLAASLRTLSQIDIQSSSFPTNLVANDYATILQVALGVGRPLRPPGSPRLLPADDTGTKGDHITSVRQPSLKGQYDPGTTIQVVDDKSGQVLGSEPVDENGSYTLPFDAPLSEGVHIIRLRGVGPGGVEGAVSPRFTLKIVPETPRGPMALRR